MPKDLCSYPFAEQQLHLLKSKGFFHIEDVKELTPTELSKELDITTEKALDIIHIVKDGDQHVSNSKSAYELLQEEEEEIPIVTFCAALDDMIGGGVSAGKITEFCGAPGMGKTQIGIQLAVDVQIPEPFGGAEGEAVYIDCEGSFICERTVEIAQAALSHLRNVAEDDADLNEAFKRCTIESILSRIHVYRCHDYVQLIGLSHILPDFLLQHPKVKLIVLDSIAFHFRYDFEDMALRSRILQGLVQSFMQMAHDNKLAVVFMNQMTTQVSKHNDAKLIPALGQSWGHACTIRIILGSTNGQRYARLLKSPSHQEATVLFEITKDGIRDVNVCDSSLERTDRSIEDRVMQVVPMENQHITSNPSKRPRIGS